MIVLTNYNSDPSWVKKYTKNYLIYDRSDSLEYTHGIPDNKVIRVPNIGSDNYDRMTWIIDNYENLPDVVSLFKGNLFKYVTREEYDIIKDNKTFTPVLTKNHKEKEGVSYYHDGIYWEINDGWFLSGLPLQYPQNAKAVAQLMGISKMKYLPFAPGCNYILPKANILKHPKSLYIKLRDYMGWHRWPAEAAVVERGLYTLWKDLN